MVSLVKKPLHSEEAREPTDLLLSCHGRIREFTQMALAIAYAPSDAGVGRIVETTSRVRTYFSVGLPLHEHDEELSVAPRLLDSAACAEVEDALDQMAREHRVIDRTLRDLDELWKVIVSAQEDMPHVRDETRALANALSAVFEAHLAIEERSIFPAIGRALSVASRSALMQEMKSRRALETQAAAHRRPFPSIS